MATTTRRAETAGDRAGRENGRRETIRIPVSGMTCAACQARVQRRLQKEPGVADASVNLMMKSAAVTFDPGVVSPERLVESIRETGYGAELASPDQSAFEEHEARDRAQDDEYRALRLKALVSVAAGLVMMLVSMPLMMAYAHVGMGAQTYPLLHRITVWLDARIAGAMPWLYTLDPRVLSYALLVATAAIMGWAGRHFYTRAWAAARHRSADMNTLVAIGTGAAFLYSVVATVAPGFFLRGGVRATVNDRDYAVGGSALIRSLGVASLPALSGAVDRAAAKGQAVLYLVEATEMRSAFVIADAVREESREAIRRLHDDGLEVVMLTGDAKPVADGVGQELGIDTELAEVLPDQKAEEIRNLQRQGKRVAMVGDGVNDAPALVTADVGIAIGAGTDVAIEAGDVVLVGSDPRGVSRIIALSRATYRKMMQNLWWAAGYNVVAIPLAAGVLWRWGVVLHPAVGAVLMSMSTVIVALNAQMLRRARL